MKLAMQKRTLVKLIGTILGVVVLSLALVSPLASVFAATPHQFKIRAYDYNLVTDTGTGDEYTNGAQIDPGRVIQLDVYYVTGSGNNYSFQGTVNYDTSLVEPLYDEGEFVIMTEDKSIGNGGIWPNAGTSAANKKKTNWTLDTNLVTSGGRLNFLASDSKKNAPMEGECVLFSAFFKVKDDVPAGSNINFTLSKVIIATTGVTISTSDLSLSVYGAMSNDVSLSSLTLTGNNGLAYPCGFTAGTSTRNFSITVPYAVSSLTIAATPTDTANATILAGGLGNKSLSVGGSNNFNLTVQAQDGTQGVYSINVYRLNNNAKLSTMSLTGVTLDYSFSSTTYAYTATVPYALSSTTVGATTADTKATIKSGTGNWPLTNTGATANTRKITVNAEDCGTTYASVPGNSCTSQDYDLTITRTAASTVKDLTGITIDGVALSDFHKDTLSYTAPNVANNKTSVNIGATLADSKATVSGTGTKSLNVGDNTITLTVTAEDRSTKTYTVKIRRLSNNANLKTLTVTSTPLGTMTPGFNENIYYYYTYTYDPTATNLSISATVKDPTATITSGTGSVPAGTASHDIIVTAEDGTIATYTVKFTRQKSSDATLSALSASGVTFNETFSPNTTRYTASVSGIVSSVNVSATPTDANATITYGLGPQNLNYGLNSLRVTVKAENGTTKDYYIDIVRDPKTISNLSDLKVDGTTVTGFSESTLTYDLGTVPFTKTSILIAATAKDAPDATITSGTGTKNLNTGLNTFQVVVTAQDGVTKTTYTIKITRTKSDNSKLKSLSVTGGTLSPSFDPDIKNYTVTVPYETTSTTISATPDYMHATVVGTGNKSLNVGSNPFTVSVTAENGSSTTVYNITITRNQSTNTDLASLSVKSGSTEYLVGFSAATTTYNVTVPTTVTSINLTATGADPTNQTITGTGPKTLSSGANSFTVTVTAASGATKSYTVNITKSLNTNNNLATLTVAGHALSPAFSPATTSYTVTVPDTVADVIVSATVEDASATITGGTGTKSLNTGTNTVNVDVVAESGARKTYTIVITRSASNDSSLSSLTIDETILNETFVTTDFAYTASVANSVNRIHVNATASDAKAKSVTGTGAHNLNTGPNTITVTVTAEDNTTSTYTIIVTRAKSTNTYLSALSITGGFTLSPAFDKTIKSYTAEVPNTTTKVLVNATAEDSTATVTGAGQQTLSTGPNTIDIVVTAEDPGVRETYTIVVTRRLSSDTTLSTLSSPNGRITPAFDPDTKTYYLTVPYEVDNPTLNATATSDAANILISGHTNLPVGVTQATILVTAEDGSTDNYYVNITRQPSSNNYLSSLSVTDQNAKNYISVFNRATLVYNISVANDIDQVTIAATAEDSDTAISGVGSQSLNVGPNSFTVTSTSADGTPRDYVINITRAKNSNTNLSSLSLTGLPLVPDFSATTTLYTLAVDNSVSSVTVNAVAEDPTATVTITGDTTLHTGMNNIQVTVTAEDTSSKTYVIAISRASSSNNYLAGLATSAGLSPAFDRDTLEYNINVDNSVTSIDISGILDDPNATLSGTGTFPLNVNTNTFLVKVTAENNTFRVYTINVTRDPSTNAYLQDLRVDGATVSGFSRGQFRYTLPVDNSVTSVVISATAEDPTAAIAGNTTRFLTTGVNSIDVVVTAQSGATKTYTIDITRAKSSNANLSGLSALEGILSPAFNKDTLSYTMSIPYESTHLTLSTPTAEATANVEIEGNTDFQVGSDNVVTISVVAEDMTIKTYQIQVTRQKQANNLLKTLEIGTVDGRNYRVTPTFNKNTSNYTVEIDPADVNLAIRGTLEANSATATGLDTVISISSFPYTHQIVVTSASGVPRTYTITFTAAKSSNAKLRALAVSGAALSPAFHPNITTYNIDVPANVSELDVTAFADDTGATVTGDGHFNLTYGDNTVIVTVTAPSGDTEHYTLHINRQSKVYDTDLAGLVVTGAILSSNFSPDNLNYAARLGEDAESVTFTAIPSDNGAVVKIALDDQEYEETRTVTISDLDKNSVVRIKVENSGEASFYTVSLRIQSEEYITSNAYGHIFVGDIITTVRERTTLDEFKDQFDNDNAHLKIFEADGVTERTSGFVGTGTILRLYEGNRVVDEKRPRVLGDVNGDGKVDVVDAKKIVNHILGINRLTPYYTEAGDVVTDADLNVADVTRVVNHIIGKSLLY